MNQPLPFRLQKTRVALIQLGNVGTDKTKNLANAQSEILRAMKEAPRGGVDMVILPECFNSPYNVDIFRQYAESLSGLYDQIKKGGTATTIHGDKAWPIDNMDNKQAITPTQAMLDKSPSLAMLSSVAKELGVVLVGGSIPELDESSDQIYNTSIVLDAQGNVISLHRKLHLFDIDFPGRMTFQESKTLTGGDRVTIFDCAFGRFGLGICYDMRFPESAMIASRLGAGAILYPGAFNTTTGPLAWELLLRARAVDNQLYTIACSPARPETGYPAWGHSTVVDPLAQVAETCDERPTIIYAELDPERVTDVRKMVPISMQRRFDVYPNVAKLCIMSTADQKQVKRQRFESVFSTIVEELLGFLKSQSMPEDAIEWYKRNLEYNTPGGKLNRGLSVVDTVEILLCTDENNKKTRELTKEEYVEAAVLGWCVELLQAYFLVADDMMDASITRRGHPCWYRVDGIGNIAINDAFMLEAAIYHLLKTHFKSKPYYGHLLELFHDVTFQTELGQLIDLITAPEDSVDLSKFSLKKHHLIVVYKTAFYSFYLPVALAMRMCGVEEEAAYKRAEHILIPLGEYFQVQDDYLDCYGAPEVIGKIGTDILDNKCSWNINVALSHATEEQRKILDENYGRKDAQCEQKVKDVFNAKNIDLKTKFAEYERESYDRIHGLINSLPESKGVKRAVFVAFFEKVYKRSK